MNKLRLTKLKCAFVFLLAFISSSYSYGFNPIFTDSDGTQWGEKLKHKMQWEKAALACEKLGASLPTAEQYLVLMSDLGETNETSLKYLFLGSTARDEYQRVFDDLTGKDKNSAFWTSSKAIKDGFYQIFLDGANGDSFLDYSLYKTRRYFVRCAL